MKAGRELVIMNPYDWLPSAGETSVYLEHVGGDLLVIVEYDGADRIEQKEILFKDAGSFNKGPFPGPNLLDIDAPLGSNVLGALVEYPQSEAAAALAAHYRSYACWERVVRHFRIFFLSANISLTVFAQDVIVRDRDEAQVDAHRLQSRL